MTRPGGARRADRRDRRLPPLPAARRVARAGGPREGRAASATSRTGAGRCRASATRRPGSCSSGWRRRRTAATGPAGCSPATRRATSCGRRSTPSGLADRPASRRADDGLTLTGAYVAAAVRCAPPVNKPTIEERDACAPFLVREIALLTEVRVVVALGAVRLGRGAPGVRRARARRRGREPRFGHGAEAAVGPYTLLGSYHPSQQNTFTGRLTADMFDAVILRAAELARAPSG